MVTDKNVVVYVYEGGANIFTDVIQTEEFDYK